MPAATPTPAILAGMPPVEERAIAGPAALAEALAVAQAPFVVRGLVRDWPLVRAGLESPRAVRAYLLGKARAAAFTVSIGEDTGGGRLFYDDSFGMNFRTGQGQLADIFAGFDQAEGRSDAPTVYIASTDMRLYFDGLTEDNPSPVADRKPLESIWIGNATRIAAHNDFPRNLACCAAGRRRFIVFPPDQFANLSIGPLENTPAGRAVSMVDFHRPDAVRHPRFAEALRHARLAELEPGDAIYIPSLWWHHVEGLDAFNVLVNYWWRDTPAYLGQPQDALYHAILAIRDLPAEERALWAGLFDHYVFSGGEAARAHLPAEGQGVLAPLTADSAGRLRAYLLRSLNR